MSSFWRLMSYIKNYQRNVVLNVVCNVFMAAFTVISIPAIIPLLQIIFETEASVTEAPQGTGLANALAYGKYYVSQLIVENGRENTLIYICVGIVILFFFKNLFRYLSLFFMAPVRNGIVRDIRQNIFNKMLVLPLAYFSEAQKGDLMARISADVQEVEWSILNVLEAVFREPLIIVGCLVYMILLSPSLTLFVFVLLLFTGFVIGGVSKTLKRESGKAQAKLGRLVSIVEEALSGLRIIKGFNAEGYQRNKFLKENNEYRNILTNILWRRDLSSPLSEFLGITVVSVLLWYGSKKVFSMEMDAEEFFSFLFAFFNIINPAKSFSSAYYNIQKGIAAAERAESILDADIEIYEKANARKITAFEHSIEYKAVSFKYANSERNVLDKINLKLTRGKVVALVGASGAGKSTLVDLLPRFYDVNEGEILVDGVDLREYDLKSLRALMGIVSQEAILFNDTIYNNIVFGMKDITEEEVIQAAKIAHAHEFIEAMEDGYQSNIGDRGNKLSGGQRQRITIARAVLKNPPILILDEATSALDSASEKLVQKALNYLMQGRTAIVIAHRLSTIQHADEILVMQDGKIIERGSHEGLLKQGGSYRKLVQLQAF